MVMLVSVFWILWILIWSEVEYLVYVEVVGVVVEEVFLELFFERYCDGVIF